MKDRSFIDTNIFLYAFSTKDNDKQLIARKIILKESVISVQVVNETSSNLLKKLNFDEDQIRKFINSSYARYEIIHLSKEVLIDASKIRERYKYSYYDTLIISAALTSGCTVLFSEDMQHGQMIENRLRIINPFIG